MGGTAYSYVGPVLICVGSQRHLAFSIPIGNLDLKASIEKVTKMVERKQYGVDINVRPDLVDADTKQSCPAAVHLYVRVPDGVDDPLEHPAAAMGHSAVHSAFTELGL